MGAQVGNKGFVSEINVTPFVDVMLVLLIIFMVTAPMMTEGLEVDLPKTQAADIIPTEQENVILTVKKDGSIFIGDISTQTENLASVLTETVTKQKKMLLLQADKDVPYGVVVDIMGRVKAAGIDNMSVIAERVDDATLTAPSNPTQPASVPTRLAPRR